MKQPDDDVGLLPHLWHILPRRCFHVVKAQTAPQILWQPQRNPRRDESKHSYPNALPLQHDIRRQIRFARVRSHHIGSQHGHLALLCPAVIDLMACFHVMVTHRHSIIAHEIKNVGTEMPIVRVYHVIVVR